MADVRLCHEPPPPGPRMHVMRIKAGNFQTFTMLSLAPWGCFIHWNGRRSECCHEDETTCPGCTKGKPRKWKGYFHAYHWETRREVFLEVTRDCAEHFLAQVPDRKAMRGLKFTGRRVGKADTSRCNLEVVGYSGEMAGYPPPKDPLETLKKLWDGGDLLDRKHVAG